MCRYSLEAIQLSADGEGAEVKPDQEYQAASSLDIKSQGLGACIAENFLAVPKYQRAFSWDNEDVSNFLADVNTAFSNAAAEYFMGSVVLQGADQKFELVDGQQRLTSATLFVAAARDFLDAKGMSDVAKSLESQFLLTKDTWSQQVHPRLTLSVYENDFFLKRILLNEDAPAPSRESHERLLKARDKFADFVRNLSQDFNNWFQRLQGIVLYLERKTRVIQVIVPSQANAYVIFETLNDRGKDLSASDLLKNHLFGRAEQRIDEVQTKWNQMLGVLEAHGGDDVVITYIRQLWSATREVAREKELFSKIKERIATSQQVVDFASELLDWAGPYSAILTPSHPRWKELGGDAAAIISSLDTLKVERYRPALLALLVHFKPEELVAAMRYILNGSVRYLVAVGAGGGTLEAAWSAAARNVSTRKITTAKQFAKDMQAIIPNDEVFRAAFKGLRVSKSFLARYFLSSLERFARGEKNCELVPNTDVAAVNVEHVLPEHLGPGWAALHADVAAAYYGRLGNQVLLKAKVNSEIGNRGFEEKQKFLAASEFGLTRQVGESKSWGPDEIERRQADLADMAVKVWAYEV